jgi:hypothetical protein
MVFGLLQENVDGKLHPLLAASVAYEAEFSQGDLKNIDQFRDCLKKIADMFRDSLRYLFRDYRIRIHESCVHVFHLDYREETVLAATKAANLRLAIVAVDFQRVVIAPHCSIVPGDI